MSIKLTFVIAATIGFFALPALAAGDPLSFTPQVTIPGSGFMAYTEKQLSDNTNLICEYIAAIYQYAIAIIGILAMLTIAIGGVMWLTSSGNQRRVGDAKDWIIGGIFGVILALSAFIILSSIDKNLVTCRVDLIKKIEYQPPPSAAKSFGENYGEQGQKCQEPSKRIDTSGNFYCCVIFGDVDQSGWVYDTSVKRCATYETGTRQAAQDECNNFYDNFEFNGNAKNTDVFLVKAGLTGAATLIPKIGIPIALFLGTDASIDFGKELAGSGKSGLKFETRGQPLSPANPDDQQKNTAEVYQGRCWDIPQVKKFCMGSDCQDFCKIKGDYHACLTSTDDWGYCLNNTCQQCKKHCEACADDRQCPNQTKNPDFDGLSAVVCGEEIYSFWGTNSNDCSDGKCDREYKVDSNNNGRLDNNDNQTTPCP